MARKRKNPEAEQMAGPGVPPERTGRRLVSVIDLRTGYKYAPRRLAVSPHTPGDMVVATITVGDAIVTVFFAGGKEIEFPRQAVSVMYERTDHARQ